MVFPRVIYGLVSLCLLSHVASSQTNSSQALNPQLTNLVPNGAGPALYYNGSGPVPPYNQTSPEPEPLPPFSTAQIEDLIFQDIVAISQQNSTFKKKCAKCVASVEVMHLAALTQPVATVTNLLIRACNTFKFSISAATCESEFGGVGHLGPYWAQLLAQMSLATGDMHAFCHYRYKVCDTPPVIEIDESAWFGPQPANKTTAPPPSGKTVNVLHLSDWHLDSRYDIGSEANCSQSMCCRPYSTNKDYKTDAMNPAVPASRFGYFECDAPADLTLSVFDAMPQLVNMSTIAFSIFTGDIVSHDNDDQLSRAYVEYEENATYATFKAGLGKIPIYPTLGNHDSLPVAYNTPNNIRGDGKANAMSWNYELLSSLWQQDGWVDGAAASYASKHYGAYAMTTPQGLKIISINTDFWYKDNVFNFYNFTNPDNSGVLQFLIDELSASEQADQRVWIIGHVLSGYDGTNPLPNPTALFYSIVRRFSPATIAGLFWGHTHEDQLMIYYDYASSSLTGSPATRNTTDVDYNQPLSVGFIGPSVTPLTGLNAGWRLYEVDAATFEVTNMETYIANISDSSSWGSAPEWKLEYDARKTYDAHSAWPASAPLNASFWHGVTEKMLQHPELVETYNLLETKSSVLTQDCSSKDCVSQKVCYIRSGSAALGKACPTKKGPD
ncbi:MAG: hypothetical protein M1838_002338 [Thelocarpon superellum]|nr:MAG: hypothetical protein M1838_002338 [Thelocarpon superellum]